MDKQYLSGEEAADYMGVGRTFFLEICKKYNVPSGKVGKKVLYRRGDLEKVIERIAFKTLTERKQ